MDGASSAATVLQIIQTAAEVTSALTQYAISVREAEPSCKRLLEDLELLSRAAEAVKITLERSSTQNTPHYDLVQQCFRDDGALMQSKKALDAFASKLGKVKTKMKWTKKVRWPFKEKKVNAAIQTFERYRRHLEMILEIDVACMTKDMHGTQLEVKDTVVRVEQALDGIAAEQQRMKTGHISDAQRARMKDILDWLKAVDCTAKHQSMRKQRQSETCKWLFKVDSFVEWKECKTTFLWLHGIAGSGKSVLASAVIDCGLSEGGKLIYFYIEFRTPETSSSVEVLRSLFVQLLRNASINWLPLFDDLVQRKDNGIAPPADHDSLVELLKRAAKLHKRPIAVIDGLDECKDLPQLLTALTKLNDGHLQLFCVSRPEEIIKEEFSSLPSLSLSNMEVPLSEDMRQHIMVELERRKNLKMLKTDQKEQICQILLEKAQGMFRWIECQLDRLAKCSSADIGHTLQTLPSTLYETHDRILDDVEEREFGSVVVRRVLLWLVAAQGEVGIRELSKVLKIDPTKPTLNAALAPIHEDAIVEICGPFVRFDECKRVVTLSHYTVQEYLTDPSALQRASNTPRAKYFISMPAAHLEIAKLCAHYITTYINQFDFVHVKRDWCQLLTYAVQHGRHHIADIPEDDISIGPFLTTLHEHGLANSIFPAIQYTYGYIWSDLDYPLPVLRMIIERGPLHLLERYLDLYPIGSVDRDSPLTYAVEFDKVPQAQLLLDRGVDVNAKGPYHLWCTILPVEAAAEEGHEELIKLFMARGSRFPVDIGKYKPSVIRLLIQLGADVRPKCDKTVLHSFLQYNQLADDLETMNAMVGAGCVPESLPCRGATLVVLAAANGHFSVAEWLLDRGSRLPTDFLPRAVWNSPPSTTTRVIQWSLQHGIRVNSRTSDTGDNALHALITKSRSDADEAAKVLVEAGCNVNSHNTGRKTPLHIAVERHLVSMVRYLMGRRARVHANLIHSLLVIGQLAKFESMLRVLKQGGLNANEASGSLSPTGDTILHALCWLRVRMIAGLQSPTQSGVRFADDDHLGKWHRERLTESTVLRRAQLLQQGGFNLRMLVNTKNDGLTALRIALDFELPSPQIISFLINLGEMFSNVNYLPLENINWAAGLPWYADAVAACRRATTSQSMTPHDIRQVRHVLACLLNSPERESHHIVDRVTELAEFWACTSITHYDIGFGRDTTQVLSVPEFPLYARSPMVQRIVFSYAGKYREGRAVERQTGISQSIRRNGITHKPFSDELELKRFSTDRCFYWIYHTTTEVFWDRHHPSSKGPNAFELASGDALILKRSAPEDVEPWERLEAELELEFYRIDVYYSIS